MRLCVFYNLLIFVRVLPPPAPPPPLPDVYKLVLNITRVYLIF